ncbi:hypothetical protein JCM6882_007386 [Rhodosporidiobolus microsporus]
MDSPAPSPAPSPAASTSHSSTGRTRPRAWSSLEERVLVEAVRTIGAAAPGRWEPVQEHLVEQGYPQRPAAAVKQHYELLSSRAKAQGVPLTGAVPLDPWTMSERALLLAVSDLELDVAHRAGRSRRSVPWRYYCAKSIFPGRSEIDLANELSGLRTWVNSRAEKPRDRMNLVELAAERAQVKEKLLAELPHLRPPVPPPAPAPSPRPVPAPTPAPTPVQSHPDSPFVLCPPPLPASPLSSPPTPKPPSAAEAAHFPLHLPPALETRPTSVPPHDLKRPRTVWEEGREVLRRIRQQLEEFEVSDGEDYCSGAGGIVC